MEQQTNTYGPTDAIVDKRSVVQPSRKPAKGWKIATVILIIFVLGLAGFATYLAMTCGVCTEEECKTEVADDESEIAALKAEIEHDEAVREVVEALDEKMQELTVDATGSTLYYATWYKVYDYLSVFYRPDGVYGLVPLNKTRGIVVPMTDNAVIVDRFLDGEVMSALTGILTDRGFERYEQDAYMAIQFFNSETGVMCTLGSGMPFSLSCGHISDLDESQVELAKELGIAMEKAGHPMALFARGLEVKDSTVIPYQTAEVSIGGAVGLFYRVDPDAEWQFFMGTQGLTSCDNYNTDDLRKAFAGTACHEVGVPNNTSTVQP